MDKNFLIKEFAKHINYAIDLFQTKFEPTLVDFKTQNILTLTDYQKFISSIFLLDEFKNLLLFWETGFGKTIQCIYIIKNLFLIYPQWKIFLFVKSSLKEDPWNKTINKFLPDNIKQHIYYVHYDVPNADNLFLIKRSSVKSVERIFYIFDESHDFIKKLIPKEGNMQRRLTSLLKPLIKDFNKPLNKTIFMTATPINDSYIEFNYIIYFLRNGNMTLTQQLFSKDNILLEPSLLKKTCLGLCSYQRRSEIDIFKDLPITEKLAGKKIFFVKIFMSDIQTSMYKRAAEIELKSRARGFRVIRKLVNTLAFHDIKIKNSEEDYTKKYNERLKLFKTQMSKISFSKRFIEDLKNEVIESYEETSLSKNLNFIIKNKLDFSSSLVSKKHNKSTTDFDNLNLLHTFSSKYVKTCQLIKQARGKCLIYQPFVEFEGVKTLLMYMDKFDITYIEYTQKTRVTRTNLIQEFNNKNNINGEKIKACVLSSAGTEGISLLNITDLIIMDLPWSGSILEQIFGRAIRLNSHLDLPLEERYVNIHILINITNTEPFYSIDEDMLNIIKKKEKQKTQILEVLLNSSIETIHQQYPDIESVEKTNFYPLMNNRYDIDDLKKNNISILKYLIKIFYSLDRNFEKIYNGYLDEKTNLVYSDNEVIGKLVIENDTYIFKIINNQLVYLIEMIN